MKKLLLILLATTTIAQTSLLSGKKVYYFGDSITQGLGASNGQYPIAVSSAFNMVMINKAAQGTTMMKQIPINVYAGNNMEFWATAPNTPIFNPATDGLVFVAFLTNDVGLNLPNYTVDNYSLAIDKVINGLLTAGWSKDRIKFIARYWITNTGLNYTGTGAGVVTPSTLTRYNQFATVLINKCTTSGIQIFDFWDILSVVPNPLLEMDTAQRHPKAYMHSLIANKIISELWVNPTLSTTKFELDDTYTNIEYYNLLGQKILEPKGITIVKCKKKGITFTKKIYHN